MCGTIIQDLSYLKHITPTMLCILYNWHLPMYSPHISVFFYVWSFYVNCRTFWKKKQFATRTNVAWQICMDKASLMFISSRQRCISLPTALSACISRRAISILTFISKPGHTMWNWTITHFTMKDIIFPVLPLCSKCFKWKMLKQIIWARFDE